MFGVAQVSPRRKTDTLVVTAVALSCFISGALMLTRILALPALLSLSPLLMAANNAHKDARNMLLVAHEAGTIQAVTTSSAGPADITVDIRGGSVNSRQRTAISDASYMIDRVALQLAIDGDASFAREWASTKADVASSIQLLVRSMPQPGKVRCGAQFTESEAVARITALYCVNENESLRCAAAADQYDEATEQLDRCLIAR